MSDVKLSRLRLARRAIAEFRHLPLPSKQLISSSDIDNLMVQHGLVKARMGLGAVGGWTSAGLRHINALARSFRAGPPDQTNIVSNDVLADRIRRFMEDAWNPDQDELTDVELENILKEVAHWLESHLAHRVFLVPCRITPFQGNRFSVGPVNFCHISTYPIPDEEDFIYRNLLKMAENRSADWMAEIAIQGRESEQAAATADLAVDIALSIVQILSGDDSFHRAGRITARLEPTQVVACWSESSGPKLGNIRSNDSGLGVAGAKLHAFLRANRRPLDAMGERLAGFLAGSGATSEIDTAWCNAAHWYHEALADNLEASAVAKLVIAIEVLLRAESAAGSGRKLRIAVSTILGLSDDHHLPITDMPIGELIKAIVRIRSRVLHGTWFALQPDLPTSESGLPRFETVEGLARSLLLNSAVLIAEYARSASPTDNLNGFLSWAENKRTT